ncbi:RNA exonuclease 3 [Recurvomyces mirabilis]|uniref:RNA exonuclease 3 n=1 Tax=Recurvomyces mirabilis TaxID=574656 RepID=A0AAE0WKN5_9PEZI|nr:RNA exonuclease 3 [Recurvomyces mirabilis]KAK5151407.1 RNA exonuclease 3 [Recurvomyces mirabilis]
MTTQSGISTSRVSHERQTGLDSSPAHDDVSEPPSKRRRVTYENLEDKPPSKADLIRQQLSRERQQAPPKAGNAKPAAPASLKRPVSPPAKTNGQAVPITNTAASSRPTQPAGALKPLTLNPRLIANDPAGHAKRSQLLKLLHAEMVRLSQQLVDRKDVPSKDALLLSPIEAVQLALDEEEKLARESGNVYANVIKNRIFAYKKMSSDDWVLHVKTTALFKQKQPQQTAKQVGGPDPPLVLETGLTPAEEAAVLTHLIVKNQQPLEKHGYVVTPPTAEAAAEAAAAVEKSLNYEVCDRCSSRFRVFPNRNDEGLLTSNGSCHFHPMRKIFPSKARADTGPKEPYYPCCNELLGSAGCTTFEHHVFKASSPARLAAVMLFIVTPPNDAPTKDNHGRVVKAVAFDCEMGYTTLGMEMIRITAVSWPEGKPLFDVLVRPLGVVLDLNSRFSGVWPEDMANAVSYQAGESPSQQDPSGTPPTRPIMFTVDSPEKARELLCSYLAPETPLIGHAIDNDLNVVRICHPTIVDTVILFPHPRGLPSRYGLKTLSSKYLRRAIQQGGERGHDSLEDSVATGDLVRVKVGEKWKMLKATGWSFVDDSLVHPPPPTKTGYLKESRGSNGELTEHSLDRTDALAAGTKRRKRSSEAGEESLQHGNGLKAFLERDQAATSEHKLSVDYLEDGKGK